MVNLIKLKEYGAKTLACNGKFISVEKDRLPGGNSLVELERIKLTFESCSGTLDLVQWRAYLSEEQVMLALAELASVLSLPELSTMP